MRPVFDKQRLERFLRDFGDEVSGDGVVYLTGGATALLHGWREMTIDVDIKAEPEPAGFFEAIAKLKNTFPANIELASPELFIPELPGWKSRSLFIGRYGKIDYYHYDPYSQALAKLERGHARDAGDVEAMFTAGLIKVRKLGDLFYAIESELIRYPSIDVISYKTEVEKWMEAHQ